MRILYYSKPPFGDCDFPLIKALMEKGHEVRVLYRLSPYSLRTTVFDIARQLPVNGIVRAEEYVELRRFARYMPMDNVYMANDTAGRLGWRSLVLSVRELWFMWRFRADVIQYVEEPWLFHFIPLWLFRRRLVFTIHDGRPHTGDDSWKSRLIRKAITRYGRKFILLNKAENALFEQGYGVSPRKVYNSRLGYYDILDEYGDKSVAQGDYVLFFGRISRYKGVEYLLRAMEETHKAHPGARLVVAGAGEWYFDVSRYEREPYIEFRHRYIGMDELADLIRGALFVVCPYTEATQSGVVYSAFALRTPVVATRVGGLPEMIDDGETGLLVPPRDIGALARAMDSLLSFPERRRALEANIAKSAADGKGSWRRVAQEYLDIYTHR